MGFFLHNCIQIRNIVGHEFSDEVSVKGATISGEQIDVGRAYRVLAVIRDVRYLLRDDLSFEIDDNNLLSEKRFA